jgi:quercetin dioxygenase-like cupin family protein
MSEPTHPPVQQEASSRPNGVASEMPRAEPIPLDSLVAVAPAAIVSRTLLQKDTGTITLFSFDRGQGLSEHTAPFDAFVQVLAGELELTIGGVPIRARAGEAVIMPAHVPHALQAPEPARMLLVMIRTGR